MPLIFRGRQEKDAIDSDSTTVFESENEQDPWFSVDLGREYFVYSVNVDLRSASFATKFDPITVNNYFLISIIRGGRYI